MTTHLILKRRFVALATLAVACFAFGVPTNGATATVPPTPPPDAQPAPDDQGQLQIEESWALTPAVSDDPDRAGNRSEFSYLADPGAVLADAVTVFNLGNVSQDFRVYATDAFNNDGGQFDLLPGDQEPTDVGSWVTVDQESVTVPPGMQATIPITIRIPVEATPGDHVGAIVASSPTSGSDAAGNTVNLDRRTGSRLYVRVNGDLVPDLAVANVDTSYDHAVNPLGGTAHVTYRIENRGNVRLGGTVTLTVAGPFGIGEKKVTLSDVPELLPGEDVTLTADVQDVPQLMLGVTTVQVEPAAVEGFEPTVSEGTDNSFVPPVAVLLIVLAFALGLLAWRAVRRHRTQDPTAEPRQDLQQQPDAELERQPT